MAYKGVDISNNNGYVDMSSLKQKGYSFVISKATEGCSFKDSYYVSNIQTAKNLNLLTGAYHFARFRDVDSAKSEANFFKTVALQENPDFLALDLEYEGAEGDLTEATNTFMNEISKAGKPVLLYSYPSFLKEHLENSVQQYLLWIAHYGVTQPDIWCWNEYSIWQYSANENGFDANVMTDEFYNQLTSKTNKESESDMKNVILYLGDADVFAAILVSQKNQCPLMRKADFENSGLKADNVITIGGTEPDRFSTFKAAANLI